MIPGLQLIQERPRQFLQIRRRSVRLCPHGKWLVPRVSSPWPKDWSLKAATFFPTQDDPVRRRYPGQLEGYQQVAGADDREQSGGWPANSSHCNGVLRLN
ncbi:hypothetical protein MANI_111276 [Metarhizium anisopliae]|nr:hypothetical protein MANI_111276 [Metarhizium anisopliae]